MLYVAEEDIERFIREDAPYIDLTTLVLGIGDQIGRAEYYCRENTVICGMEEVMRIFEKLGVKVVKHCPSGTSLVPEECFLTVEGRAANLHMAWKLTQNLLEYCSGIATRTRRLIDKATRINPRLTVLTTRKMFPGTKSLAIKAVVAGGGFPHRLGLSETILVFPQHLEFCSGGLNGFIDMLPGLRHKACEKMLIVEAKSGSDAVRLCRAGVDGVQFDKIDPQEIKESTGVMRNINPAIVVLAAGGINESNIEEYAVAGVDAVVTSAVYFGKPADIGVKMTWSLER